MSQIRKRLERLKNNIEQAAEKSKRSSDDIHLVCVTKYAKIEDVVEAVRCGCYEIGENRLQMMREKYNALQNILPPVEFQKLKWHFIGHLQTNKINSIFRYASMIQSVDSLKLVEALNEQAKSVNKKINILIQINISKEDSKFGVEALFAEEFLQKAHECTNISIKGLMGIAQLSDNEDLIREEFRVLKQLFDVHNEKLNDIGQMPMSVLSMGMTNDYNIAIEQGSNMIRVGSAIFGG